MLYNTSCVKVSDEVKCFNCGSKNVNKNGHTKTGKQQFYCKQCGKRFIEYYSSNAYLSYINEYIIQFTKEGMGIRSIARVLKISTTTLLKRILIIARKLQPPAIAKGQIYEVDELRTYVKRKTKLVWIVCALERSSKRIVRFATGARTNKTLKNVLDTLLLSKVRTIYTDNLINYRHLISNDIHRIRLFQPY